MPGRCIRRCWRARSCDGLSLGKYTVFSPCRCCSPSPWPRLWCSCTRFTISSPLPAPGSGSIFFSSLCPSLESPIFSVSPLCNFFLQGFFFCLLTSSFYFILFVFSVLCPLYYYYQWHPVNFVLLGIFTLCISFAVGLTCAFTSGKLFNFICLFSKIWFFSPPVGLFLRKIQVKLENEMTVNFLLEKMIT